MKVKDGENVADGLTKHVDRQKMEQYVEAGMQHGAAERSPRA